MFFPKFILLPFDLKLKKKKERVLPFKLQCGIGAFAAMETVLQLTEKEESASVAAVQGEWQQGNGSVDVAVETGEMVLCPIDQIQR
ncbi:hypothetical protein C5167_034010, partial [Papaver somniferum]